MISAPVRGQALIQPQAGPLFDTPPWLGQPFPQQVSATPIQEQQAMQAYVRQRMAQQQQQPQPYQPQQLQPYQPQQLQPYQPQQLQPYQPLLPYQPGSQ